MQGAGGGAQGGRGAGAAAVARGQLGQGGGHRFGAFFALLQSVTLGGQLILLALARRQFLQLVDGVSQEILFALGLHNGVPRRSQAFARGAPGPVAGRDFVAEIGRDAVGIQQTQVGGRVGQPHLVVLALHLHQQRADPFQRGRAHRRVVHPGARAAIPPDRTAQHDILVRGQAQLFQQRVHGMGARRGEAGGYARLIRAGADQRGIRARAQGQAQAVEQNGFAGARLPGQHGQSRAKAEIQPLDQDHVTYRQRAQHIRKSLLLLSFRKEESSFLKERSKELLLIGARLEYPT